MSKALTFSQSAQHPRSPASICHWNPDAFNRSEVLTSFLPSEEWQACLSGTTGELFFFLEIRAAKISRLENHFGEQLSISKVVGGVHTLWYAVLPLHISPSKCPHVCQWCPQRHGLYQRTWVPLTVGNGLAVDGLAVIYELCRVVKRKYICIWVMTWVRLKT